MYPTFLLLFLGLNPKLNLSPALTNPTSIFKLLLGILIYLCFSSTFYAIYWSNKTNDINLCILYFKKT